MSRQAQKRDQPKLKAALKEYPFCLHIYPENKNKINVYASRSPTGHLGKEPDCRYVFLLQFKEEIVSGISKKFLNCCKLEDQEISQVIWSIELDTSTDLEFHAKDYYHRLKHVWSSLFEADRKGILDEEILGFLETLNVQCRFDHCEFNLQYDAFGQFAYGCEPTSEPKIEVSKIDSFFYAPFAKIPIQIFLELTAARINIHIGDHTEQNIADFIISWKNGEIRENFEFCIWNMDNSKFDKMKLVELLDGEFEENKPIVFQQTVESKKIGRLYLNPREIRFFTEEPIEDVSNVRKLKSRIFHVFNRALNFFGSICKSPNSEEISKFEEESP